MWVFPVFLGSTSYKYTVHTNTAFLCVWVGVCVCVCLIYMNRLWDFKPKAS
jgi:hypothetical protein